MENGHAVEVNDLVKRFVAHQKALGLTDARFAARYKQYVGSHKTWIKLKEGDWAGHVNEGRILPKLKKFSEQLDGARSFDAEQFNNELPYVVQMNAQFERLLETAPEHTQTQRGPAAALSGVSSGVAKYFAAAFGSAESQDTAFVFKQLCTVNRRAPARASGIV